LCINQENTAERTHPVQRKGRIYGRAYRVIAWLGVETDYSRIAIYALHDRPLSRHEWVAIAKLFNHEYWTRVWIVQEIGFATYIQLQCGIDRIGISPLKWIMGYIKTGELDPEHSAVEECGQILNSLLGVEAL
jgi:hypothetical protein